MASPQSLFEKIWSAHEVAAETPEKPGILYVDLHLTHEVTSPQGFDVLRSRGLKVRRPELTLATIDHSTPTLPARNGRRPYVTEQARAQVEKLRQNCKDFGVTLHDWDSDYRGIVHVIGPELGATSPGKTIVCGDSHTSTHGAFGALAFGIGATEVGHVLATQCVLQRKPKSMRINVNGELGAGVTAKDLILHIIGTIGVSGGTGHVIEYAGDTFENMHMEQRMTVCNMSIEAGARAGMIAPDQTTFDYLKGRPLSPEGADFEAAVARWKQLRSDPGAHFDKQVNINAADVEPTISYGTHPGMVVAINSTIPEPADASEKKALQYMGLAAGQSMIGTPVNVVFVGSCTNSRISDLRAAADQLRGRKVHPDVTMLVVPGSEQIYKQAEAEGLHQVFIDAGAQWRLPGCSMCLSMNGDIVPDGALAVSTSNRNFEGRQGPGSRTLLASPAAAAAAAVAGCVADPRSSNSEAA